MSNRDLLKEALADAKVVKEMAITNAKAALEEAFAPQLKAMLEKKIMDLDEEEEHDEEPVTEVDKDEDDATLEELLRELEEAEGDDEEEKEEEKEEEEDTEDAEEDEAEEEDEDEEIDFENMDEESMIKFIEKVVDDMIANGEIEGGHEGMEDEAGAEMDAIGGDEMDMTDDATEIDLDVDGMGGEDDMEMVDTDLEMSDEELMEAKKKKMAKHKDMKKDEKKTEKEKEALKEGMMDMLSQLTGNVHTAKMLAGVLSVLGVGLTGATISKLKDYFSKNAEVKSADPEEFMEALKTIKVLKQELTEINLLNSKLLYTNKIFKAKNLTEANKIKVLSAFDKAESVKEVKLVYETLSENLTKLTPQAPQQTKARELVRESKNFASTVTKAPIAAKKPVVEMDPMVERMKKLAGLI
jgi:hypothetical protein